MTDGTTTAAAFKPIPGRGGARNRADRRTWALSDPQALNVQEAVAHAVVIGLPLNRLTTVHWQAAGVRDGRAATARFLKLLGDAVRSAGGGFAYVWVREDGAGKGAHAHILWHGPPDLPVYRRRLRRWLSACGASWRRGVCDTRAVGRSYAQALLGGDHYRQNMTGVTDYVLKGAVEEAREHLGIARSEPGGLVIGKRCGVSQNIAPAARACAEKADRPSQ